MKDTHNIGSEGMEKDFMQIDIDKKVGIAIPISDKIYFKTQALKKMKGII